MFQESLNLIDQCHLTHLHVFPYSPRDNTPAAFMPQVDKATIKIRAKILRQKGFENLYQHLKSKIGKKDLILVERSKDKISVGKDQHFLNVIINQKIKEGNIVPCIYTGIQNNILLAKKV